MKEIKTEICNYLIKGIGNVVAEEWGPANNNKDWVVSWPAVVLSQNNKDGSVMYQLEPLIPSWVADATSLCRHLEISKKDVIYKQKVGPQMRSVYVRWQIQIQESYTGIKLAGAHQMPKNARVN